MAHYGTRVAGIGPNDVDSVCVVFLGCLAAPQAEYPVENVGLSPRQNIEIRSQSLPDSFAMLILDVTADLGPPVSYVKTQSATRLELIVSKKGKLGKDL